MRRATADDLDKIETILHNDDVRLYLCDNTILPRETIDGMLTRSEQLAAKGLGLWIIEQASGTIIGVAGLEPVSAEIDANPVMAGGIEPIIAISRENWGRGLASEAMTALIHYACNSLQLSELVAAVDEPNTRSHRLMESCGFVPVGRTNGPANELILYRLQLGDGAACQ